jgi:hypothetical protein
VSVFRSGKVMVVVTADKNAPHAESLRTPCAADALEAVRRLHGILRTAQARAPG